jgi:hypothetical protein
MDMIAMLTEQSAKELLVELAQNNASLVLDVAAKLWEVDNGDMRVGEDVSKHRGRPSFPKSTRGRGNMV